MLHGGAAAARFETTDDGQASREVMFLVLDYSWSMTSNKDGGRKTRWQRLCESLKSTLDSVKVGTEVRIAWIGGSRKSEKPVLIRSETEKQALLKIVKDRGSPPNGNGTPLFATLKAVCGEANDLAASGCSITINVISDGESNEVPIYRARESWTKEQIQDLDNQYTSLFSDRRFNACLVWINPGEPPGKEPMLGGRTWCTGYKAPPSLYSTSVQSTPVTVELSDRAAPGALSYGFFVPDNIWGGMVGKPAQLVLSRDGKEIAEVSVQIQDSSVCAIPIPEGGIGGLSLSLKNIPQPEGALISEPRSVDLIVSEPRKISVSSTRPADGTALKEGGTVEFAVVANPPDAKCEWSFGDGSAPSSGGKVSHKYDRAGEYTAQVVVRKEGFEPVTGIERKIKVRVLHTKVALEPFEAPVVGREAVFRCKGEGPVTGYTWYVDGESFAGKDSSDMRSSEFRKTFSDSGEHAVHVRADMSFVSSEESERKTFKVGEAPFVRIDAPLSGSSMTVGDETNLSAHAEGGVAAIEWKIDGPEPKSFESPVVGAAAPANWTPGKPGEYTIRAIDKANKADPSGEVKITVRPRDVALRIAGISDGETVWTGSNFSLKAETKGVESVRWSVIDEDRGTTNGIGSVKTDLSGIALKAWTPSFKESDGARLILAEDETGAAEPASVLVNLKTKADLSIEKPSDYHPVAFGTPVELAAKADGAVENIRWFVDGKEIKGKGKTASFTPALERGVPEKLFKVHAEAFKPSDPKDRPSLRTAVRTVVARCPELQPHIDLQKKDWDVGAPVQFKVVSPIGRIGEVVWSFGDGTPDETAGAAHSHVFAKDGAYAVSARAICADCGASFDAGSAGVEIRCPDLAPIIVLPETNGVMRASFGRRERIEMQVRVRDGGKVRSATWQFGDGTAPVTTGDRTSVHHEYENYAEAVKVRAAVVCDRCGREYSAERTLTIEAQPPQASFSIAPDKATFTVKSRIKLQDTSLGDVDKCVWTLNGEVFAECRRGESVDLVLPSRPTECMIGMTASNALGASSEAQSRTIRVRFGWWAVLIFLIAGGFFIWLAWRLFGRNTPRDWQVYCWAGKAPELKKGQYPDEKDFNKGLATELRGFWSIWSKRASVELGNLLFGDPEYETPDFSSDTLKQKWRIEMLEGDPDVSVEGAQSYDNQSAKIRGGSSDEFGRCYFLFQNISPDSKEKTRYVRFYVDRSPKPSWRYPALFILTVLLVLAAVFRACLAFAI